MGAPKTNDTTFDVKNDDDAELADIAAPEADGEEPSDGGEPSEDLNELITERDELRERLVRALADSENIRKRAERDRREAEQYGGSKLARDLLPVFDNLNRALEAAGEEERNAAGAVIEGIELTLRELLNVFGKHGVTAVAPEVGDRFDPQLHQAMFEAPVPDIKAGDVIQVVSQGFSLHGRLLRPAQVGVSSASS